MLGGNIGSDVTPTCSGGDGGNIDNAPRTLLNKGRCEGFADIIDAGQINSQHTMPQLVRVVEKFVAPRVACVVDQDVYPSQPFKRTLSHVLHLLRIGDITCYRYGPPPLRLNLSR